MCTVSYLPLDEEDFILTHNRDEHLQRKQALPPALQSNGSRTFINPIDGQAGGTWFATSEQHTLCLLNGAFEKHSPLVSYRKSRGAVIQDFFEYKDVQSFATNYNFNGIQQFTLIIVQHAPRMLFELVWDYQNAHFNALDHSSRHIRSSVTLYEKEQREQRENWFDDWAKSENFNPEAIQQFHKFAPKDSEGFLIQRDTQLTTISMTQVVRENENSRMGYEDFLNSKTYSLGL